jgi:hypothetical protein
VQRDVAEPLLFRWRRLVVTDDRLSAADRHLALTLALHMDIHGGSCFPSLALLARETRRKKQTLLASIATLENAGYLDVKRGGFGRPLRPNRYTATCPKGHLSGEGLSAPRDSFQVSEGTHEFFKNSPAGAPKKGAAAVCAECETGLGLHSAECSQAVRA